ncbi:phage tail protein [Escherichia coli]|uniref:phage tail protein n=1 Tax=Escherichia coli TaxID=562 RepID=UPI0010E13B1F|nr:phage tail protein [Escherichia coli]GDO99326.1 phage P2 GpU family protein [Escherichia coli]
MFAVLGDTEFELITYWDGFDITHAADFAEHARIEGKPGLQFTGDRPDEIRIALVFHRHYCSPDAEMARLREAMKRHQAMALVFGNGDYRGWFVITEISVTTEQTDSTGGLLAVSATLSLREYSGDPKNPLTPPAVRQSLPVTGAVTASVRAVPSGVAGLIRDGVRYARQAQSVFSTVVSAVRVAQKVKDNPVVALGRVPGLMHSLGDMSGALGRSFPALSTLASYMPDAARIAGGVSEAAGFVSQAHTALKGADTGNIAGILNTVHGQLEQTGTTLERLSPGLTAMASRIITRRV